MSPRTPERGESATAEGGGEIHLWRVSLDQPAEVYRTCFRTLTPDENERAERLRFNLSHAEGVALIALTRGKEVGVDVEVVREEFPGMEIAEGFFPAREVETLRSLPEEARTAAFFLYWTRKEAYITPGWRCQVSELYNYGDARVA